MDSKQNRAISSITVSASPPPSSASREAFTGCSTENSNYRQTQTSRLLHASGDHQLPAGLKTVDRSVADNNSTVDGCTLLLAGLMCLRSATGWTCHSLLITVISQLCFTTIQLTAFQRAGNLNLSTKLHAIVDAQKTNQVTRVNL